MLGHYPRRRGPRRNDLPKHKDLQVCWANVGKNQPFHITILELAYTSGMDVLCVQEPWTAPGDKTQNHPGWEPIAPIDSWQRLAREGWEEERPRVMTYTRKGPGLKVQKRRTVNDRDLLWVTVNGFLILNAYRSPGEWSTIEYVKSLEPGPNCLVGGDFNVRHDMFEPGVQAALGGTQIARWATESGMDFIGDPGAPTQRHGHVLDLTFSNIPFARTQTQESLHSGSDHLTSVTTIPGRGAVPLDQFHHRVPECELPQFSSLVQNGTCRLPDPKGLTTPEQIDKYANALAEIFNIAIKTVGKADRGGGSPAPWWTNECKNAHLDFLAARGSDSNADNFWNNNLRTTVRNAKREYWRKIIDGVKTDKDLYKVIGWHKLATNFKAPPLKIDGVMIEDTLEKAKALRKEVLGRFSSVDDLDHDPLGEDWEGTGNLNWNQHASEEEVERYTIGVSSTSPGTDRVTVRLLKACWRHVQKPIHLLFNACLTLSYFPRAWKLAEVAMLPKVGKKDKSSPRSWRPIALLSCVSKGLERLIAKRLAWTALQSRLLSPQHGGALPKRSAMDLVASFTHSVEEAIKNKMHVTMVTMDVQGAFDALLPRRLLARMTEQGWPLPLLRLVQSFLTDRKVRVRLEKETTEYHDVECGTPQGSPLSPVLYMLYLAELLNQDTALRFGYADDVCLFRATHTLKENVKLLSRDVAAIIAYGNANKIYFAPEKLEMIHLTRMRNAQAPPCKVNNNLTITPITKADKVGDQPALRWLGVWFDRKLRFKRHVAERAGKARQVARHIKNLARTKDGPPALALRKAVITCVIPAALYGTEAWYAGRTKWASNQRSGRPLQASAGVGWHIDVLNVSLSMAAKGVLPVWRTTPTVTLFRDSGLPSAFAALEDAKLRFAMRLQTIDEDHPLVRRLPCHVIAAGKDAGKTSNPKTKVQALGLLFPGIPRPKILEPHFSPGCRTDPTEGSDKETASKAFKAWWAALPPEDVTIFSDGSELNVDGTRHCGYGFTAYQGGKELVTGYGSINACSHVFDAEAIGAWKGLRTVTRLPPSVSHQRIWMCIDSTSVIWGIRGDASQSSQWAFHNIQGIMQTHDIRVKWSPGHTGIEGNEAADKLADLGAAKQRCDEGLASEPTVSGIRSIFRKLRREAQLHWWHKCGAKLARNYKRWGLDYAVRAPAELDLPRSTLHRLLAIRSSHGDFSWYHRKFAHEDAKLECSCGRDKSPTHIIHCRKAQRTWGHWPSDPPPLPLTSTEGIKYLAGLMVRPADFQELLKVTGFYTRICTR